MKDLHGMWHLFVYDTARKMWHKEDNLHASAFCAHKGELYCIDDDAKNIITMFGSGTEDTAKVQWMVETGEMGIATPDMKYISSLNVRLSLDAGTKVDFYAKYDMSDEWVYICTVFGTNLRSYFIPIRPRRCDHMKLRVNGEGMGQVYSITKTIERGSNIS
jgi:hypothetical protein